MFSKFNSIIDIVHQRLLIYFASFTEPLKNRKHFFLRISMVYKLKTAIPLEHVIDIFASYYLPTFDIIKKIHGTFHCFANIGSKIKKSYKQIQKLEGFHAHRQKHLFNTKE